MRTVVAYELVSADGVAEAPDTFFGWDEVLDANLAEVIRTQDAVVLGRRTYDEWAGYWPGSDLEPFAGFINGVRKHVATSTPLDADWSGATAIEGDLAAFVHDLKRQPGGDIGIHASISVVQALLGAGLVDDLRLVVAPAVAAGGRRLLDGTPPQTLATRSAVLSPTGHLAVHYRVTA